MDQPSKGHRRLAFSTMAVHGGERAERGEFSPVSTPIYQTAGFYYPSAEDLDRVFDGSRPGYVYSRYDNPTVRALERVVASLEGMDDAVAFGSGMAAIHAALLALGVGSGDRVLCTRDCYGATQTLLSTVLGNLGVHCRFIDMTGLDVVERVLDEERPKAVFVEVVSNPLLRIVDVPAVASLAHAAGARIIVDSTFTPPCMFRSAEHGADLVLHSATKYLSGHGDSTGGIVAAGQELSDQLRMVRRIVGGVLAPMEAWLTLRGIKTLVLRFHRQCDNAMEVARWLRRHAGVKRVHYPGLEDHPQHSIARRLFSAGMYGAVVSFHLKGAGREEVFRFMDALELFLPAPTMGDIYSLVLYPPISSHRGLTSEQRASVGITDDLVRLSMGIEDVEDLKADLEQALRGTPKDETEAPDS